MTTATKAKPKTSTTRRKKTLAPVLVTMVLDRSGSMGVCRAETIEAFNSYVEQLRRDEGVTLVTLRQFDNEHDLLFRALPAAEVPTLTHATYEPRASTALNDAIALAVADADTAEVPKGTKHLLVIVTDGYENASREHTQNSIKALLEERRANGWTVVFLQGDLDNQVDLGQAQFLAAGYGVTPGNVALYSGPSGPTGPLGTIGAVGAAVRGSSSTLDNAFASANVIQDFTESNAVVEP